MQLVMLSEATSTEIGTWILCGGTFLGLIVTVFKINDRFASKPDHDKLEKRVEIVERHPTRDDFARIETVFMAEITRLEAASTLREQRLTILEAAQRSVNDEERERKHLNRIAEIIATIRPKDK